MGYSSGRIDYVGELFGQSSNQLSFCSSSITICYSHRCNGIPSSLSIRPLSLLGAAGDDDNDDKSTFRHLVVECTDK